MTLALTFRRWIGGHQCRSRRRKHARNRAAPEQAGLEEHVKCRVNPRVSSIAVASLLMASLPWVRAQQPSDTVAIDPDDIGGVATSSNGPEAGVWIDVARSLSVGIRGACWVGADR